MLLAVLALGVGLISGCGSKNENNAASSPSDSASPSASAASPSASPAAQEIKELKISFVPSKDPEQIITATEPLKDLLKNQLATEGYNVDKVSIDVGTTYEAVGEALSAGTTDIGLIPGGTYVLYDDGADVILTATRAGLSNDSEDPALWNKNKPTEPTEQQATYYRGLIIAGPSAKGQELGAKINNGEELTWDDLNSANWAVMSSSSSSGYIYPTLWLQEKYQKGISDLKNVFTSDSYGSSFARLAAGQADVLVVYADGRRDYVEKWNTDFGRTASIWDETNVIGVTDGIYNDTISVSKKSKLMTDEFKKALQDAFMAIAQTEEGKQVIAVYSHEGYQPAQSSDYDAERQAQEFLKSLKQ
ncbi:PhnD/SsuA/transferrin family substrate-binding protein [Cohnella lubricantis]|uniref:PhnD/SsuA/transferrin family substrate-binding protein n=2 Tax=Cohnella lubricantis TaxID=2163172 RepID=A0A841TCS2_9BACL|nr:phosphate/phosphite/phosphonate ABC transporter substrate-binding protein [Cohnella lubricantis]MBB6679104.1 PhnD/SsuA/transferrin family substrate-binding protein [Cohnella lubricantis]